ncbi:TonB-dependent receptor [Arcobacter sp. FWKO B]|nr:TonB-dependent receptor [Arcobacter sp. FWKO B]
MYMGEKPGVAVVIDGVPVQETAGKINIDLDNIESIKVIKGGASFLYGNDAIAGAIIITTKRPKGQNISQIETEIGSFSSKRFLASTNQSFEKSALQLQGSTRTSDGYWEDAYVREKSINGKYQYYINDLSDITFGLDLTNRKTGDGNSVSGTTNAETNPTSAGEYSYGGYYNSDLIKTFITYSEEINQSSHYMLRFHKYIDDKTSKTGRTAYNNIEKWDQNGIKGEYYKSFNKYAIMVGLDLQKNTTDETQYLASDNSLRSQYDTDERIYALYGELNNQITDSLTSVINLRYDNLKYKYNDQLDNSKNVNPSYNTTSFRAGLNYDFTENNSLFTSISTGFRAPTVSQISKNQTGIALGHDVPTSLKTETTYNYEIGIRGLQSNVNYEASIYQLDRKDYIGRQGGSYSSSTGWSKTSNIDEDEYYFNLGDMRSRGFELALNGDIMSNLSFNTAYTYLDAIFKNIHLHKELVLIHIDKLIYQEILFLEHQNIL